MKQKVEVMTQVQIENFMDEILKENTAEKCEDCKHFSSGVQHDGIGWENCELNYHCSVPLENMFEKK